ncbi:MAG: hydroxyisourate hydrolase [Myxococcales bacterium]|nr:hydroxyisourate hydrolase [Myxococcales bacterium]
MSPITTHILDTARGKPASGVPVRLEHLNGDAWIPAGAGVTDVDGRVRDLLPAGKLAEGMYRITFDTATYFVEQRTPGFYPYVQVVFDIEDPSQHYHVPLLLSPYGFSTYRGS